MLTLAEVLELPVVRRGLPEVVAGERLLGRELRWAHVIEMPDPDYLLKGGELVLTTGLGAGTRPEGQRAWIDSVLEGSGRRRTHPIEAVKMWSISAVARVRTDAGDLWLKAPCEHFRAEARVHCPRWTCWSHSPGISQRPSASMPSRVSGAPAGTAW